MDRYFISTNNGYIFTNDEKMAQMPFTIDEMIADPSVLDGLRTAGEHQPHKIFFVMKNDKNYWEFGGYA